MEYIIKSLILLIKICLANGAMFVKEETYLKIENGEQLVGRPVPFENTINEQYCTILCTSVDTCTGVSYKDGNCTGIITFVYPDEGVTHILTSKTLSYRKHPGPPEMCIHFEDLSKMTLNGAIATTGFIGQGLDFPNSGSLGQTADAGIWKGKACFVTPQTCKNGFTLSFWAKIRSSNPDYSGFITTLKYGTQGMNIRTDDGSLHFWVRMESATVSGSVSYSGHWDKWTQIALTLSKPSAGPHLTIYFNGVFQDSKPFWSGGPYQPNDGRLVFGRRYVDQDNYYGSAVLDELCSWNMMLSDEQIYLIPI